ncbi:hypothetical protein STENM223S_09489 [Streptomyces tendae]
MSSPRSTRTEHTKKGHVVRFLKQGDKVKITITSVGEPVPS